MNEIPTSVARRAYISKYFKDVIGINIKVYGRNSDDKLIALKSTTDERHLIKWIS